MPKKIIITGSGGIGRALGLLLREIGPMEVDLFLGDVYPEATQQAATFIANGSTKPGKVETFTMPWEGSDETMAKVFQDADIVLDCLPGGEAPRIAKLALENDMHYANLTEYVQETNDILSMAANAKRGFALQNGLAPGFVNVLGNRLYQQFCADFGVTQVDYIGMKVGALTQNTSAPHFYGFTWSPIGVATEYVKPAVVIRNHKKTTLPALSEPKLLRIKGKQYSEDLTSGGAADMPDRFEGITKELDYKTIRYPGHYRWVNELVQQLSGSSNMAKALENRMLAEVPLVEDDMVIIYACVQGKDSKGRLQLKEKAYEIYPMQLNGKTLRAIQSTTAAGIAEVAALLLTDQYHGPLLQSQLNTEAYMGGDYVGAVYK